MEDVSTSPGAASDRSARIEAAVAEYLHRRARGESVDTELFIVEYLELAPDLASELRKVHLVEAALLAARQASSETETHRHNRSDTPGSRLEVRCPSCHTPLEVAVDTALTDITCSACGSHFSLVDQSKATRMAPSLSTMGRFELIERIGVGGFGSVWKARDKELDRTVAVKIPRQGAATAEEQEKFFREARAAAQLRHPSIVSVHEVGRDGDSVFIVSDFVRGVTLGDWLSGQQLTGREAAALCAKIADALHHAHEHGVIHRDLKPANVMIDGEGEPHLMDFGLARRDAGEVTVTIDGHPLGTPAYMSPEQAAGEAHTADRRSDVYSLGVILFQLLTGELPFRGNARMLMHQVIYDEPPSPRKLNGSVPKDLETITLKSMEKDPKRRYASTAEVAAELRRFQTGEPIHARPIGRVQRGARWVARNRAVSALMVSTVLALIGGTAASLIALAKEREASGAKVQAAASRVKADILDQIVKRAEANLEEKRRRPDVRMALQAMSSLAEAYRLAQRMDAAIAIQEEMIANWEKLQDDITPIFFRLDHLVDDYVKAGRSEDAIKMVDRFAAVERKNLGSSPFTRSAFRRMTEQAYLELGRPQDALKFSTDNYESLLKKFGPDDEQTKLAWRRVQNIAQETRQPIDSIAMNEKVLAERRNKSGPEDSATIDAARTLAEAYLKADRRQDTLKVIAEYGLFFQGALLLTKAGPEDVNTLMAMARSWPVGKKLLASDALLLGELRVLDGDSASGEAAIRQAITTGLDNHFCYKSLGWSLLAQGKQDEARAAFGEALKSLRQADGNYDLGSAADADHLTAAYFLDLISEKQYVDRLADDDLLAGFPWFYVAQRREIGGQPQQAIAAYKRCVDLGSQSTPQKAFAQWRLEKLTPGPSQGGTSK